jgi:hypothetical protein
MFNELGEMLDQWNWQSLPSHTGTRQPALMQ